MWRQSSTGTWHLVGGQINGKDLGACQSYNLDRPVYLEGISSDFPPQKAKICKKCMTHIKDKAAQAAIPKRTSVTVYAFTGMKIGDLAIKTEHPDKLEVLTKQGAILVFDKRSGKQLNAKNEKYANYIK